MFTAGTKTVPGLPLWGSSPEIWSAEDFWHVLVIQQQAGVKPDICKGQWGIRQAPGPITGATV